ncbi:MAG: dTDP-4-dehydrorhamnose reductase [Sedimentisphaerales bacterium]|nr:dTDP-4-dehydrorhamnose reductase [Sedimentisphaerales bacterium]
MDKQSVAILGAKGMLGSDVLLACQDQKINAVPFDLPDFDITNTNQLENAVSKASAVVNCAAYTNVEKAESENDLAYKINAEAVSKLGQIAKRAHKWVLHISTDFVFDGSSKRPYVESDEPNPINAYGKSKLAGEQLLIESRCHHCIMRIEWTYGTYGRNFVTKLIEAAKNNRELKVVSDQTGSPTATAEVAKVICRLLQRKPEGLFHFANAGFISRFDMAKFVLDKLNLKVELNSCQSSDYKTAVKRPLNSCFNCDKIKALLAEPIAPWQVPLGKFLERL